MNRGGERFDIKRDQGGIVDIEFVVQYLVLAHASEYPALAQWSDVIRLLETLEQVGVLSADQAAVLSSRYLIYRSPGFELCFSDFPGGITVVTLGVE